MAGFKGFVAAAPPGAGIAGFLEGDLLPHPGGLGNQLDEFALLLQPVQVSIHTVAQSFQELDRLTVNVFVVSRDRPQGECRVTPFVQVAKGRFDMGVSGKSGVLLPGSAHQLAVSSCLLPCLQHVRSHLVDETAEFLIFCLSPASCCGGTAVARFDRHVPLFRPGQPFVDLVNFFWDRFRLELARENVGEILEA